LVFSLLEKNIYIIFTISTAS